MKPGIKIVKAEGFNTRFCGFMLKKNADYGFLFERCTSVHTFFMRFNLDLFYLDKENKVVRIKENLKPWRIALPVKNAVSILEVPAGLMSGTKCGDKIFL